MRLNSWVWGAVFPCGSIAVVITVLCNIFQNTRGCTIKIFCVKQEVQECYWKNVIDQRWLDTLLYSSSVLRNKCCADKQKKKRQKRRCSVYKVIWLPLWFHNEENVYVVNKDMCNEVLILMLPCFTMFLIFKKHVTFDKWSQINFSSF